MKSWKGCLIKTNCFFSLQFPTILFPYKLSTAFVVNTHELFTLARVSESQTYEQKSQIISFSQKVPPLPRSPLVWGIALVMHKVWYRSVLIYRVSVRNCIYEITTFNCWYWLDWNLAWTKGQLILEWLFDFPKNQRKNLINFCPSI